MTTLARPTAVLDQGLSELDREMAFLLQVTPVNATDACRAFPTTARPEPEFEYRPLPFDVGEAAARLRSLPPPAAGSAWAPLLDAKREDLEVRLRMLAHRGSPAFRELGHLLYGTVEPGLLELAEEVLAAVDPPAGAARTAGVGAHAIAGRAVDEVAAYRRSVPDLECPVEVRDDVTGLVVSEGRLMIGREIVLPPERVQALLHHEIGTHVLTRANGRRQPLRILGDGLAGYEELQEALGVVAEYLAGGMSAPRLRRLAERVVAVASMQAGAAFRDTWEMLQRRWGMGARAAFGVAMRVHRAGGLAKDLVYLRGLRSLLRHLGRGGGFDVLFVGKISLGDVPTIERLVDEGRIAGGWALPRYLEDPAALARLDRLRAGCDVPGLLA